MDAIRAWPPLCAILTVLLAAPMAEARCVTRSDLEGAGIRITLSDGITQILSRRPDGTIQSLVEDGTGWTRRSHGPWGLHWIERQDFDAAGAPLPGTQRRYVTTLPPDGPPKPREGATASGTVVIMHDTGTRREETREMLAAAAPPLAVGPCAYEARAVTLTFRENGAITRVERFLWLPTVGTAVLIGAVDDQGPFDIPILAMDPVAP